MSCIGTAGHVDHGKSTLVQALTGIDPDRLAEEKQRGMTIDLGFAWMTLPSGREVSIVDVPGHESFIKNMLAGVGGIDIALLVIAADEGVMPQTREHLAILDLLRIPRGIVVLTKSDLVDQEWLELVSEEIREVLQLTTLHNASIIPVSAQTGQGLTQLVAALDQLLETAEVRKNVARPRLPIDRIFSLPGFGTIVTGTLLDGTLKIGQEVEVLPQGLHTRIRTLQTHKQQITNARPGSRVALNLPNVARSELERGNVISLPGQIHSTHLCDVQLTLLADAPRSLAHNTQIDFFCGSQEIPARVRLLDCDELQPGKNTWAQLRFTRPAVVVPRDRFIIRIPSPGITIGGGEIVDVQPRFHRRHQQPVLEKLARLAQGTPEELILEVLDQRLPTTSAISTQPTSSRLVEAKEQKAQPKGKTTGNTLYFSLEELAKRSNLAIDVTQQVLETLLSEGRVRQIGDYWLATHIWENLAEQALALVSNYHQQYPLRRGYSKEEWRARLKLTPKLANELLSILQSEGSLTTAQASNHNGEHHTGRNSVLQIPDFEVNLTTAQQQQCQELLARFQANPFEPPTRGEAEALIGTELVNVLIEQGQLIKVSENILFLSQSYKEAMKQLDSLLREQGHFTVAEARDKINTTRKYIVPLLEHMDALHITRRHGDERYPGSSNEKIAPEQSSH